MENKKYICPVCGYDRLDERPYDIIGEPSFNICPCCGFEYGFDDMNCGYTFESYRNKWINDGAKWFSKKEKPRNWNLEEQLKNLEGLDTNYAKLKFDTNGKVLSPSNYKNWSIRVERDYKVGFNVHLENLITNEKLNKYYENFQLLESDWNYEVEWNNKK